MNRQNTVVDNNLYKAIEMLQQDTMIKPLYLISKQQSHQHCMICGSKAEFGLQINFYSSQEYVWAMVKNNEHHQGFTSITHGGFVASLLDAIMCQSLFAQEIEAVTADLSIRYLHEIPINSTILLKGHVISYRKNLYNVQGELFVDQQLMAKSTARFIKKNIDRDDKKLS